MTSKCNVCHLLTENPEAHRHEPATQAGLALLEDWQNGAIPNDWRNGSQTFHSRVLDTEAQAVTRYKESLIAEGRTIMQLATVQRDVARAEAAEAQVREWREALDFAERHSLPDHNDGNVRVERGAWERLQALASPTHQPVLDKGETIDIEPPIIKTDCE